MLSGRAFNILIAQKRKAVLYFIQLADGYVYVLLIAGFVGVIILTSGKRRHIDIYILKATIYIYWL